MKRSSPKTASAVFFTAFTITALLTASPAIAGNPGVRPAPADDTADLVSFVNSRFALRAEAVRYADPASGIGFTLDRTGVDILMKFDGSDEVVALSSTSGHGGAEFLKNDAGRVLLKVTERGNVIVYLPGDDGGAGVVPSGPAEVLSLPVAPEDMTPFIAAQVSELQAISGQSANVSIDSSLTDYEMWSAEALRVTVMGLVAAEYRKPTGVKTLILTFADAPGLRFDDQGELTVSVAPHRGYAGRPSSELVARTMTLANRRY